MDALRHFRVLVQGFGFGFEKNNLKKYFKKNLKKFLNRNSKKVLEKVLEKFLEKVLKKMACDILFFLGFFLGL